MKKQLYIISALFLLLGNSCTNEMEIINNEGQLTFSSINASMAALPTSRTHLENGGRVVWDVNDQVGIFSDTQTKPVPFICTSVDDSKASFTSIDEVSGSNFLAFYPYENCEIEGNELTYTLSSNTQYTEGTYFRQCPMIAKSNTDEFKFKHTCGIIRFSMTGTQRIQSLVLEGNNGEIIAGTGIVDFNNETPVLTIPLDATNASTTITMSVSDLELSSSATDFYFIIPETAFTQGLNLTINYWGENSLVTSVNKKTQKSVFVSRSIMKSFRIFDTDELIHEQEEERIYSALMAFYNATNGDNWINNENWGSDKPFNEWYGVEIFNDSICNLMLSDNNLVGAITNELDNLTELVNISVNNNKLTAINVSKNKKIRSINCHNNYITSLDFANNIELEQVICENNYISELNFSKNPLITTIWCNNNQLKVIDISCCGKLESLLCFDNQLTSLDVTKCNELVDLWCYNNHISLLDVTNCTKLESLLCGNNQLAYLDITKCCELKDLRCYTNSISSLDVTNCKKLYSFICNHNQLTKLDVAKCDELNELCCSNNGISMLDVANCVKLETLDCSGNQLTNLDISKLQNLKFLLCMSNKLIELNVSNNTQLTSLICAFNKLSDLDVSNNVELEEFWCHQNKLSSLDVSNLHKLRVLLCGNYANNEGNHLTELDLSHNAMLEEFSCYGMKLTSLNTTNNTSLFVMECSGNPIASLDISKCTQLKELWCHTTNLSALDVSGCAPLEWITTLNSPNLSTIYIYPEQLFDYTKDEWTKFKYKGGANFYESTDFSKDGEVKILQKATIGNGINIILLGDAFSDRLIIDGTYEKTMKSAMESLFSVEPYKSYKDLFNVYAVTAVSKNDVYDLTAETTFSGFFGGETLVGGNDSKVFEYALKAIGEDQMNEALVVVMMNSTKYAGTCYMYFPSNNADYGNGVSVSYFPIGEDKTALEQILHHEAGGHGFAKLADEYAYEYMGEVPSDYVTHIQEQYSNWGWWKNVDFTNNPSNVKWSKLLSDTRYENDGLGIFEGGSTYWYGVWRPTENSIMRYNTGGFNAPNREAIYYRIHKLAYGEEWEYDYEKFVEYDAINRTSTASRSVGYNPMPPLHKPVVVNSSWKNAKSNVSNTFRGTFKTENTSIKSTSKKSTGSTSAKRATLSHRTLLPDGRTMVTSIDANGKTKVEYVNVK